MARTERRSIERKILTSILWVGILPTALALAIGYGVAREGQREATLKRLATSAEKTAGGLKLAIASRHRSVAILAKEPHLVRLVTGVDAVTEETKELVLQRLRSESTAWGEQRSVFSVFDARGELLLSTGQLEDEDRSHPEWAGTIAQAGFYDFRHSRRLGLYYARVVAPISDLNSGLRAGYLVEDQGVADLMNLALGQGLEIERTLFGNDIYQVAVLNWSQEGVVYYMNATKSPPLQFEVMDERLKSCLTQTQTSVRGAVHLSRYESKRKKQDVLLAYNRFFNLGDMYKAYLVVYRPTGDVFSTINWWSVFTLVCSILVMALFCVIAYRNVHNNIVRPVSLLNEGAQIIRQGDLELKLKIGTGDEIEELASSFNQMALALNHNIRQLEDSEEKYRSLVTSMRDGIYQTDPDWVVTFMNQAGAEIFGYEGPEDAIGHNLRELFLEEMDFARIANDLGRQSFVERTRIWMKRSSHAEGARRDSGARLEGELCVELSANRVVDDEGVFVGTEGIFRDVTTSVRLEQQARERSERISAINQIANVINSSLQAGLLHESLVGELRKLVDFDYAAVVLAGDPSDTSLGTVFEKRELYPDRRTLLEGAGQSFEGACATWVVRERRCLSVVDFEDPDSPYNMVDERLLASFLREFPDGTRSCLCVPLYATGRIIGTLHLGSKRPNSYSVHDIAVIEEMGPHIAVAMRNARLLESLQQSLDDVTRAREKLHEANEELKTLDEMKTNLLSNVSHELRTPLVAVMGYTDMIYNRKVGPINDVQSEYLGIAIRNIEKLVTLIENLLDFSRLHRGTEKLVFDTFDLVECARASIQNVQPVADARGIRLSLTVYSSASSAAVSDETEVVHVLVDGDKGKMIQVFNNLLSNAVKFNHNGGSVTIDVRRREDSVEVAVSDTGIGIPAEALDKVFTRFYQYDSSSTRKYGGTGIGLSIAQDIVRLHGSRITVTSEEGKGSIFRFSLPVRLPRGGEATEGAVELPMPKATNVLVELVTQDRSLNIEIRDQLASEGMDVISAPDAPHALTLARKHHPAVILVDMEVQSSGTAALDALLGEPDASSVPIVMLTDDDGLYERYFRRVSARVKRGFRKSGLLSGIHYAISQSIAEGEPLGTKILCVDDDPEVLLFVGRCLKADGHTADAVTSGTEALERLKSREYGLVLLDIAMPGMDGWETCRRIRSDASLAGIKVYLVTAKPIERATTRVQEVGADGYLSKPFKPEDLSELVRGVIPAGDIGNA